MAKKKKDKGFKTDAGVILSGRDIFKIGLRIEALKEEYRSYCRYFAYDDYGMDDEELLSFEDWYDTIYS